MKKILFILFLLTPLFILAQDIQFSASARNNVSVGEQFQLNYTINAQGNNFKMPEIRDFEVLMGPSQSFSQSTQIINGAASQTITLSYIFVLQATKSGSFTIPPAKISFKGKVYESNAVTINVGGSGNNTNKNNTNNNARNQLSKNNNSRDLFIVANTDKANPYQGEQITVTYKLFTRIPVTQYGISKLSSFTGFWSYDLIKDKDKLEQYREVVDGVQYSVAVLRKVALFPQKSGTLSIEPLEVECIVQTPVRMQDPFEAFFNDPFFNNSFPSTYQESKRKIISNSIVVSVKQLPLANKPADFEGNVGSYTVSASVNKNNIKSNDAVTLKYTITGRGNLQLIEKINLNLPPDIETYEPKIIDNFNYKGNVVNGSRTFEYLLIPRNGGEFTINSIPFSYFDPAKNQYFTLNTEEIKLTVEKGAEDANNKSYSNIPNKQDIKYVNKDIRFIKTKSINTNNDINIFYGSSVYIVLLISPIFLLLIFIMLLRKKIIESANISLMRNKKASKEVTKRLKTAKKYLQLNNSKLFYEELSKALWGYVSDKCNINNAELSKEILISSLENKNINEENIKEYISLLDKCEFARFAPSMQLDSPHQLFNEASETIEKLEKLLK